MPETVKFRYGSAVPMNVDPDEVLQVTSIGEETSHGVTRRHIAEIVEVLHHVAATPQSWSIMSLLTGLLPKWNGARTALSACSLVGNSHWNFKIS